MRVRLSNSFRNQPLRIGAVHIAISNLGSSIVPGSDLLIFGVTLTPFEGTASPGYYTAEKEAKRQAVNQWIRTANAFDGVIDFDKVMRDPDHPTRLLPSLDSGDHIHPSDNRMRAMSDAIDLSLFREGYFD